MQTGPTNRKTTTEKQEAFFLFFPFFTAKGSFHDNVDVFLSNIRPADFIVLVVVSFIRWH